MTGNKNPVPITSKTATANNLRVPAVNNHGGFGKWAFLEVTDPWDRKNHIRGFITGEELNRVGINIQGG